MKIWIDRNTCDSNLAACEQCFGQLVRTGVPDRACILQYEDDGSDTLTIYVHSEDTTETVVIPPDMRELVAYEGWTSFVHFQPPFRKHEGPPHGHDAETGGGTERPDHSDGAPGE